MIGIAIDPSLSNTCLTAFEFGGDLGVDLTVIDSVTISTQKNQNKKHHRHKHRLCQATDYLDNTY